MIDYNNYHWHYDPCPHPTDGKAANVRVWCIKPDCPTEEDLINWAVVRHPYEPPNPSLLPDELETGP